MQFKYINKLIAKVVVTFALVIASGTFSNESIGQCFEIESILVDACGSPEGENEMVRFSVGTTDLLVSDLTVSWATVANNWLGICQSASTMQTTAQLNATITTCGFLKEPVNGVLPAGAKVLLITSTAIDVSANSFDGLNDTLYVIYQCAGNTAGHFGNYTNSSSIRTLTMTFAGSCSDVVSYDRNLLVNQNGVPGGPSSLRDGGVVEYTPNGTPTYSNYGCQAPITTTEISITGTPTAICLQDTVHLTATASNNNIIWWGGQGSFSAQNTTSSDYYSSSNDQFPMWIYAGLVIPCGDTIKDSIQITQSSSSNLSVTASGTSICEGDTITLTASGASSIVWYNGATSNTITVDTAGTFYAYTSSCGLDSSGVTIAWNGTAPSVSLSGDSTICQGDVTTITASGDAPFTWQDNSNGTTFSTGNAGQIYAWVSNQCGSDTAFMTISFTGTPPTALINGDTSICDGNSVTLTASGGGTYLWNDGSTTPTFTTSSAQNGFVVVSNNCGNDTTFFNVVDLGNSPVATIQGDVNICSNKLNTFIAGGGDTYLWQDGSTLNNYTTNNASMLTLIAYNQCGSDTAQLNLIDQSVSAYFEMSDSSGYAPLTIDFTNLSQNSTQYAWDFGNGEVSSNEDEQITFLEEGTFTIQLIAANAFCTDTAINTVMIVNDANVYIPNSFSPNNDGVNDVFLPVLSGVSQDNYTLWIFNRNGEIVFSSENPNDFWDGTSLGLNVPQGVYIWKISYREEGKSEVLEKYGHINLLR